MPRSGSFTLVAVPRACSTRCGCVAPSTWNVMQSAPAATNASTFESGSSIIRWTSFRIGVRIAATIGGPTVSIGQKTPSMTSTWTSSTPARSRIAISSPRWARSAVSIPTVSRGPPRARWSKARPTTGSVSHRQRLGRTAELGSQGAVCVVRLGRADVLVDDAPDGMSASPPARRSGRCCGPCRLPTRRRRSPGGPSSAPRARAASCRRPSRPGRGSRRSLARSRPRSSRS